MVEPKTIGTLRNNKKVLVVPRNSDPNGFMSIDLSRDGYVSLQNSSVLPPSGENKSIKRIVQKAKPRQKHQPTDSFHSGRVRTSVEPKPGKSLDKYLHSELVRKSQGSNKPARQINTDREEDVVILGLDDAY